MVVIATHEGYPTERETLKPGDSTSIGPYAEGEIVAVALQSSLPDDAKTVCGLGGQTGLASGRDPQTDAEHGGAMKPSIGRIVHYWPEGAPDWVPMIITGVISDTEVSGTVFAFPPVQIPTGVLGLVPVYAVPYVVPRR